MNSADALLQFPVYYSFVGHLRENHGVIEDGTGMDYLMSFPENSVRNELFLELWHVGRSIYLKPAVFLV